MRHLLPTIAALLAGTAFLQLGNGALSTLLSLRMGLDGLPSFVVGPVMAAYFVGLILGVFNGHRLISGVGHIRAFAVLAAVMSAASLAHPLAVAPLPWGVLRLVEGFCMAGIFMCVESWLSERSTNEIRGRVLSLYMVAVYMAQGLGQYLLTFDDPTGFGLFIVVSILVSLAVVPVAAARVEAPPPPPPSRLDFKGLYAISPLGVFGSAAAGVMQGAFYGLGPYYAQRTGFGVAGTAQFMGATILGGLLLQWPIGRLSDRFDRRAVIAGLCLAVAVASAAMIAVAGRGDAIVLAAVFGGAIFTLYPLCVAHANDFVEPADMVRASGGLILAYACGAIVGPLAASAAMAAIGPLGLFAFISAVGAVAGLYAFWRMGRRPPPLSEVRGAFRPLPGMTPVATELDPRAEPAAPELDSEGTAAAGQGPG